MDNSPALTEAQHKRAVDLTDRLTLRQICAQWEALHGSTEDHAPTLRGMLLDAMDRKAGEEAVERWLDAQSDQGRFLDPLPYLTAD
ncbi:hypothetical protein IHE61_31000 [Streptomyces sp. GKU 257-1]|nr:hypothetical protein [Streptomyces sp. GKU 257-1]